MDSMDFNGILGREQKRMKSLSSHHSTENEAIHEAFFRLHWDVYRGALGEIGKALAVLHKLESHAVDSRNRVRGYIVEVEKIRDGLEAVGELAAKYRTKMIYENGCHGECSGLKRPAEDARKV